MVHGCSAEILKGKSRNRKRLQNDIRLLVDKIKFTLKLRFINYSSRDKSWFGLLDQLDNSLYELMNVLVKTSLGMSSVRLSSTLEKTVKAINSLTFYDDS